MKADFSITEGGVERMNHSTLDDPARARFEAIEEAVPVNSELITVDYDFSVAVQRAFDAEDALDEAVCVARESEETEDGERVMRDLGLW